MSHQNKKTAHSGNKIQMRKRLFQKQTFFPCERARRTLYCYDDTVEFPILTQEGASVSGKLLL